MILFTPKKFIGAMELNGIKLTHLVKLGIDRSYFIPRYKKGSRRKNELDNYRKRLHMSSIQKIADILVDYGYFEDKAQIIYCFKSDDFDVLLPKDLL